MHRGVLLFLPLPFLVAPVLAQQSDRDGNTPLKQSLALQATVQQVIRQAEPSVACVLVSRSEAYARHGQGPASDNPGKLGAFDADALERHLKAQGVPPAEREKVRQRLDLADPAHVPESYGSGVVLDEKGLVLTNYHVVRDATRVFVRLPGEQGGYADVLAADPRSDLAVLRLVSPKEPLKAVKLGDGSKAERGQFVVALANPFAAGCRDGQPSASWGIISNVRRRAPGPPREEDRSRTLSQLGTLLQTDVRLHLGCSGGALLNLKGELIGLTTSLAAVQGSDTPGGFALPIDAGLLRVIEVLKRGEEVEYGFLGVGFERKAEAAEGVVLGYVTPGSPADRRGLKPRDVILAVNGVAVRTADDLFLTLGTLLAGSRVLLDVQKAAPAQRAKVEVTLAKYYVPGRKVATSLAPRPFFRGLRVDYTSILVQKGPRDQAPLKIPNGVLVSEVRPESPAATALLKPGDVITHVNGRAVDAPPAFYQEVDGLRGPVEFTLNSPQDGQPAPRVTLN